MPVEDARSLLESIATCGDECADILVRDLVGSLDTQPDAWFSALMESTTLQEFY